MTVAQGPNPPDPQSTPSIEPVVPHFTPEERSAKGKAERTGVPRSIHRDWEPKPNRRNPVDLLEE
jgi:hypothetical protein